MPAHEAVRNLMIRKIDQLWQEHLLRMDHLRSDVNLRTVGNRDPLMEFKHDAFDFFDEFSRTLRTEIAQDLFRFEIVLRPLLPFRKCCQGYNWKLTARLFLKQINRLQSPRPGRTPSTRKSHRFRQKGRR